ncbi:MAG: hypothetical protein ACK4PR_10680, partial [Gammaproteobacteria bacterium]
MKTTNNQHITENSAIQNQVSKCIEAINKPDISLIELFNSVESSSKTFAESLQKQITNEQLHSIRFKATLGVMLEQYCNDLTVEMMPFRETKAPLVKELLKIYVKSLFSSNILTLLYKNKHSAPDYMLSISNIIVDGDERWNVIWDFLVRLSQHETKTQTFGTKNAANV